MKILLITILVLLLICCGAWAFVEGPLRDPHAAMNDFLESRERFEDQLTDPLVLAGPRVRPLVLSAVADREMKHRRYALAYLGCAGYTPAQERLRQIVNDETERDYFRADALESLWRLDHEEASTVAQALQSRQDFLGQTAVRIVEFGQPASECRSWFAALTRRHD